MGHKYITDLGVDLVDTPFGWLPNDDRQALWQKEQEECGFDGRETWSLDYALILLVYERLKMYDEKSTIIDKSFYKFKVKEEEWTQQQCIDFILQCFEVRIKNKGEEIDKKEIENITLCFHIIGDILQCLWW